MLLHEPIEIIAVSYFRPNDLNRCIESVIQNTSVPFNLTIIDNSIGAVDKQLSKFKKENIKIINNTSNIGKGASFKLWYNEIMKNTKSPYFISLDSDVVVPKDWLLKLIREVNHINKPLGAIAPVLMNNQHDTFNMQITNKFLTMHGGHDGFKSMLQITPTIYYNKRTAGSLFLIDRSFYEKIGGYPGDCLFGHDDGFICKKAIKLNKFIGFTSAVSCIHSQIDNTIEYMHWKSMNINRVDSHSGHWDQ